MSRPENDKETEKEKKNRVNDSELARILTSFLSHWLTFFPISFSKTIRDIPKIRFSGLEESNNIYSRLETLPPSISDIYLR